MLHFFDRAGFADALTLDFDPQLKQLLTERITALTTDLMDYTEYVIVEPGDTEADIVRHIGLSPLIDPIDGIRFGESGFHPGWDWLANHDGWFEIIFTFGSSFAYVVLIEDADGADPELRRLCHTYSSS